MRRDEDEICTARGELVDRQLVCQGGDDGLSLRRAERVRNDLIGRGIPGDKIQVAGRGEREPLVPTEDEVAEPRNRRVEITVR